MTRDRWKNTSYRKFRNRRAFITYVVDGNLIDVSNIEYTGPIYLSELSNDKNKLSMHMTVIMKTGNKIKYDKDVVRLFRKVTYTNIFGQKRIKRVPLSAREHWRYYRKHLESDGAKFNAKLERLAKAFINNVCIVRNKG